MPAKIDDSTTMRIHGIPFHFLREEHQGIDAKDAAIASYICTRCRWTFISGPGATCNTILTFHEDRCPKALHRIP